MKSTNNIENTRKMNLFCQMLSISLIAMAFALMLGCEDMQEDPTVSDDSQDVADNIKNKPKIQLPAQDFEADLEQAVPTWDEDTINTVPSDISKAPHFTAKAPLFYANIFTRSKLTFSRISHRGTVLFENEKKNEAIRYDETRGLWKYITPPPFKRDESKGTFSNDEALLETKKLFKEFSLPEQEQEGYVSTGVGEVDMNFIDNTRELNVTARHVRLFRKVNDIRVWKSRFMATYTLDGEPFRVEARWPEFRVDEKAKVKKRATVIKELAKHLEKEYGQSNSRFDIRSELVYKFRKENQVFEPRMHLSLHKKNRRDDEDDEPREVIYSLTKGLSDV